MNQAVYPMMIPSNLRQASGEPRPAQHSAFYRENLWHHTWASDVMVTDHVNDDITSIPSDTISHDVTSCDSVSKHDWLLMLAHQQAHMCEKVTNIPKKNTPYVTPSPTYLGAPSLPEPTTALLTYKHLEYWNGKSIKMTKYKNTITKCMAHA